MKRIILLLTLCFCFCGVTAALAADEIVIKFAWAFKDRFPEYAKKLDLPVGNVLQVGAMVKSSDFPIKEVVAKNLDTGEVLKTSTPSHSKELFAGMYMVFPMPPFDPSKHMGVWEINAVDEKGREAVYRTHRLDKDEDMPFMEDLKASGNSLAPTISWKAPMEKDIPQGVTVRYKIRLLKSRTNQLYRSKAIYETTHQIPEGKLKAEDIPDTYVRVECEGLDKDDSDHPVSLEIRSITMRPLIEALGK